MIFINRAVLVARVANAPVSKETYGLNETCVSSLAQAVRNIMKPFMSSQFQVPFLGMLPKIYRVMRKTVEDSIFLDGMSYRH